MFHALGFDQATGTVNTQILYSEDPGTLPEGQIACTQSQYQGYLSHRVEDGEVVLAPESVRQALALAAATTAMTTAVQTHLDAQAQARGYDNLLSAISYADEPAVPRFQADGQAFRAWRSLVWAQCHELLAQVQDGTLAVPTEAELLALLPQVQLPSQN